MNKKASVFILLLTIIFLFVLLPTLYILKTSKMDKFDRVMGENQAILLRTYERGEIPLYYIDESAVLSYKEVLDEISKNSFSDLGCGTHNGYVLLNTKEKSCYGNVFDSVKSSFEEKLNSKLNSFYEPIPEISYRVYITEEYLIGISEKYLRIDVGDKDPYNFVVIDRMFEEEISAVEAKRIQDSKKEQEEDNKKEVIYVEETNYKCQFVANYAIKYIGCPYSLTEVYILPPHLCRNGGLTCATFVSSVVVGTLGRSHQPYGHGREKCSNSVVYQLGTDPKKLQPGDIFATEYQRRDGSYTAWGHTGMYVGRGYVVPDSYGGPYCYRQYRPDPKGDYIFIHSYGWQNMGPPGVCFDTFQNLFIGTPMKLTNFCRLKVCA